MPLTPEEILAALQQKVEAGVVRPKRALAVRSLADRLAAGQGLTEMQEELLREIGAEYGIA
jgi:hypothetical protein